MAGVGPVVRDSLMAFSPAFQSYPEAYPALKVFVSSDLDRKETASVIPAGCAARYRDFLALSLDQQRAFLSTDEGKATVKALADILEKVNDSPQLSAQLLTILDGAIIDEKNNIDLLLRVHKHVKSPVNLITLLNRHLIPSDSAETTVILAAASHLLAAVLAEMAVRPGSEDPTQKISELVSYLIQQADANLVDVVIYSLMPLFKVETARTYFLSQDGVARVIVKCLQTRKGASQPVYAALFCLWMISFSRDSVPIFLRQDYELIPLIVQEIRRTDKEKVLRMALSTLKNISDYSEQVVEIMVDNRLINEIDLIAKRVLKDPDVVELVRDMGDLLQKSMKILSTYEKYLKELNRGELVPGITHSEKFWKENFRQFESNKFENVQKLVTFLANPVVENKPQTVILALGDLGEFARFHPYGKTILEKLGAKEHAMNLLKVENRGIRDAALLCTQKIMVHQWQRINI